MKPREFYDTVVQMRKIQKEYFKTRNSMALRRSKRGEIEMTAGKDPHLAAQDCRFP